MDFTTKKTFETVRDPEQCLARLKPLLEDKTISKVETAFAPDDDVEVSLHMSDGSLVKFSCYSNHSSAFLEVVSESAVEISDGVKLKEGRR